MRTRLSRLLTDSCKNDPSRIILSGDHGYALFDQVRSACPDQFVNVGIAEQAMIGYAAGLVRAGFKPIVYGLAAFVPMRVLEQIKLDVCHANLPVIFLGDGAGLVYSTLGNSHQCGEDMAAVRPLPNIRVYSPCDAEELEACFREAAAYPGPAYLRIGKGDRPVVHSAPLEDAGIQWVNPASDARVCLVATGSFSSVAQSLGRKLGLPAISVQRIKPLGDELVAAISRYERVVVMEEHNKHGGLYSAICEMLCEAPGPRPRMHSISLRDRSIHRCGSYQYALSEHGISDEQVEAYVRELLVTGAERGAALDAASSGLVI